MKRKHSRIFFYLALVIIILFTFLQVTGLKLTKEEEHNLKFDISSIDPDFSALSTALKTFKSIHDIYSSTFGKYAMFKYFIQLQMDRYG